MKLIEEIKSVKIANIGHTIKLSDVIKNMNELIKDGYEFYGHPLRDGDLMVQFFIKYKKKKRKKSEGEKSLFYGLDTFKNFRKKYPGSKRGFETEFNNFKKKHKDYIEVLPKLMESLEREIEYKEYCKANNKFCPEWKHLSTWINQRCWEEKHPSVKKEAETGETDLTDLL